jgi:uncharacterized membrane protein YhaH (DUF805 family)
MNWQGLFLQANGRIGQKDFWIGFAILFVAGIVLNLIPVIGMIAGILLIYPWVCVYSKRLHDMGKTGWLAAVPFGVFFVAMVLTVIAGGAAMFGAASGSTVGAGGAMAALGMMGLVMMIAFLVWIGFTLWLGLTKGEAGTNQYGAPPVSMTGTTATV